MRHTSAFAHLPMQTGVHTSSRRGTMTVLETLVTARDTLLPAKLLLPLPRKACAAEAASGARSLSIIT